MNMHEKLAKMLAKANSTPSQHEANSLMDMAYRLMAQHNIELSDLGRLEEEDKVVEYYNDEFKVNSSAAWRKSLSNSLAAYYGVRNIYVRNGTYEQWYSYGRESAIATFAAMWPYIDKCVLRLGNEGYKTGHYKSSKHGHVDVGNALAMRISSIVRERKKTESQQTVAGDTSTALVPVFDIETLIGRRFPNIVITKKRVHVNDYGKQAAATVSLNDQVGGRRDGVKLLR